MVMARLVACCYGTRERQGGGYMDWRLATRRSSRRGVPRVGAKAAKALDLCLCQPEL